MLDRLLVLPGPVAGHTEVGDEVRRARRARKQVLLYLQQAPRIGPARRQRCDANDLVQDLGILRAGRPLQQALAQFAVTWMALPLEAYQGRLLPGEQRYRPARAICLPSG